MFNSKGETLINLKRKLKKFEVPASFIFNVKNWETDNNKIVYLINQSGSKFWASLVRWRQDAH